ncbi:MAG: Lrp/AsnC ligand binding domain-containing protein [Candidatus Thermoplasmatota archaeon]|nr:Lrp/AsnC ligand binding domain-containing protein [Candidatus Thermoplasmatota archaeon]
MVIGYVMISTGTGVEKAVFEKLQRLPEIAEIYPLFGEFDIIAKIEVESYNQIGEVVVTRIRSINGVLDTKTLTVVDFPK